MDTRDAITVEQALFIHRNAPPAILGGTVVALIVAVVFWNVVPQWYLVAWSAAILVLTVFRMSVWHAYRDRQFDLELSRRWLRAGMTGAALSGAMWGMGSLFMFPPGEIAYQLIFLWAVSMMAVAGMFSYSAHVPTYMSFFLPSTIPAIVVLALQGTVAYSGFAAGMVVYFVIVFRFVSIYNKMFIESQKLRFENLELVAQLTVQKEAAEVGQPREVPLPRRGEPRPAPADARAQSLPRRRSPGSTCRAQAKATLGNASQCAQTMDGMFRALLDISRLDAGSVQPQTAASFRSRRCSTRTGWSSSRRRARKGLAAARGAARRWVRDRPGAGRPHPAQSGCATRFATPIAGVWSSAAGAARATCAHRVTTPARASRRSSSGCVFEEFYQVGNRERDRSKGLGLGLAIVERLAKLMQAKVHLASTPGRGSSFTLELPLAAAIDAPPAPAEARPALARRSFAGSLVAVIDDEEMILSATRSLLEQWKCRVVTAVSGAAAMEQLSTSHARTRCHPLRLPPGAARENGLSVIDALRAEFNEEFAPLITGDTGPERLREIQASGLRVLHKPVHDEVLREALGRLLGVATVQVVAPAKAGAQL